MYEDTTLTTDALLGWVLAVGIAVCGWLLAFWGGSDTGHQALAAFPERLGAWSDDGDLAMIGLFAPFIPLIVLPGAFGSTMTIMTILPGWRWHNWPTITDQSWRVRCGLTGALAALVLFSALESRMALGHHLGVAEMAGVTWLKDGKVVERRSWTAAQRIDTSCLLEGRHREPTVRYSVTFDGHPVADLSPGDEPLPAWMARIAPLDAQLRATPPPWRRADVDSLCIEALRENLTPPQIGALRALLNAP
jgi:hypothetical protein